MNYLDTEENDPTSPEETIRLFDETEENSVNEITVEDIIEIQSDEDLNEDLTQMINEDVDDLKTLNDKNVDSLTPEATGDPPTQLGGFLRWKKISGTYKGKKGVWTLDLRIDIDGIRPMRRISGDFFRISGNTRNYFGSFTSNRVSVRKIGRYLIIKGSMQTTFGTSYTNLTIIIKRNKFFQQHSPVKIIFSTPSNRRGSTYVCKFKSKYFRTVQYEEDYEIGVTSFDSYNTGSLPSGGRSRTLSVASAYAEAGIHFQVNSSNQIPNSEAGTNRKWSDSELHASMVQHFSLWKDNPQWKVWMLAAYEHEIGPTLYGIMFDQAGKQRQGCATFHRGIGGNSSDSKRLQLYTYVHELGHCFNLLHAWQKSYANPPVANRPTSLSWMNYPWRFNGGPGNFWNNFAFQFDDLEIIHVRHAFYNNVVFGGNDFIVGSAIKESEAFAQPTEDNSGISLTLRSQKIFSYAEPVVVEIKLNTNEMQDKEVIEPLHPDMEFVHIAIKKPNGQTITYKPLMEHCMVPRQVILNQENPSIFESAYIGYGKDGFYFDEPGLYQIRAAYYALDGSVVISNTLQLRVRDLIRSDEDISDLFMGDEQGTLFYLIGSDSESLSNGNSSFDKIIDSHSDHPLSVYARFIKGYNYGREFKNITSHGMEIRQPNTDDSVDLLEKVVEDSQGDVGLDNISLNSVMRHMASVQKMAGDKDAAKKTLDNMIGIFEKKKLKEHILLYIKKQADNVLKE